MSYDVLILADPAVWDTVYPDRFAPTGFWQTAPNGHEVFNLTVQNKAEAQAIIDALNADTPDSASILGVWIQGRRVTDKADYPHIPDDVVALMKPHEVYDENGDLVSSTPATQENPNWGHVYQGQGQRFFAGPFSSEFASEFL
jgi:hypothetical protein